MKEPSWKIKAIQMCDALYSILSPLWSGASLMRKETNWKRRKVNSKKCCMTGYSTFLRERQIYIEKQGQIYYTYE